MMDAANAKLKERVKELRCLYDLSRIALQAGNDLSTLLSKTLSIVPEAMQYPELAEVSITVNKTRYATKGFGKSRVHITSSIGVGKKKFGLIKVGYRAIKEGELQVSVSGGGKKSDQDCSEGIVIVH